MTIKELAEIAGVSKDTIIRKVKELFPGKIQPKKRTILNQKDAIHLMAEIRKKGFVEPMQNASDLTQNASDVQGDRIDKLIEGITLLAHSIAGTQQKQQNQEVRLQNIETKFQERKALLPAPKKSDRDNINQIVREYAHKNQMNYKEVWMMLYTEFNYRMKKNFKTCAKNRNMTIMDYIETEGLLSELLSVAMEYLV